MHHRPSDGHPEPHFKSDAATLLQSGAFESRARRAIEAVAARIAAREAVATEAIPDLVELRHVERAIQLTLEPIESGDFPCLPSGVFISYSHDDDVFVSDISQRLDAVGIAHFKADQSLRISDDWDEGIWKAIADCQVFLSILTPRFIENRWCSLEAGAARVLRKPIIPALAFLPRQNELPEPFRHFQATDIEGPEQRDHLVIELARLIRM
jgi:hypothetical protein